MVNHIVRKAVIYILLSGIGIISFACKEKSKSEKQVSSDIDSVSGCITALRIESRKGINPDEIFCDFKVYDSSFFEYQKAFFLKKGDYQKRGDYAFTIRNEKNKMPSQKAGKAFIYALNDEEKIITVRQSTRYFMDKGIETQRELDSIAQSAMSKATVNLVISNETLKKVWAIKPCKK